MSIEDFASIGSYINEKEKNILKNRKPKISKIQNSTLVRTIEKKSHEKLENLPLCFVGGVAF